MNDNKTILDQRECLIYFHGHKLKRMPSGTMIRDTSEQPRVLYGLKTTFGEAYASNHKFRVFTAELQVEFPELEIDHTGIIELKSPKTAKAIAKSDLTTARRMVTKTGNALIKYEKSQKKILLPDWENSEYINAQRKHIKYLFQELEANQRLTQLSHE